MKSLSWLVGKVLGNVLKYGQIELYFNDIENTSILFINGLEDQLVPREAYQPMWDAAPGPKEEIWVEGRHIDPNNPQKMRKLVELMSQWTQKHQFRKCYPQNGTD